MPDHPTNKPSGQTLHSSFCLEPEKSIYRNPYALGSTQWELWDEGCEYCGQEFHVFVSSCTEYPDDTLAGVTHHWYHPAICFEAHKAECTHTNPTDYSGHEDQERSPT